MQPLPWTKKSLPDGYRITTWKDAAGNDKYSVFWGDDRLMSFASKQEAFNYALLVHEQQQQGKHL